MIIKKDNFTLEVIVNREIKNGMTTTSIFKAFPVPGEDRCYVSNGKFETNVKQFSIKDGKVKEKNKFKRGGSDGETYDASSVNGKNKYLQQLHAQTFCYNDDPINKTEVDHINGCHTDNRADNLRFVTRKGNMQELYNLKKYGKLDPLPLDFTNPSDVTLEELIIEFAKQNDDKQLIEDKTGQLYEVHLLKQKEFLEFVEVFNHEALINLDLQHDKRLERVNFAVISIDKDDNYKLLAVRYELYQAHDIIRVIESNKMSIKKLYNINISI